MNSPRRHLHVHVDTDWHDISERGKKEAISEQKKTATDTSSYGTRVCSSFSLSSAAGCWWASGKELNITCAASKDKSANVYRTGKALP